MDDLIQKRLDGFFSQQQDVSLAYLFGSVARGEATAVSDVDVAVLLPPETDPSELLERQLELDLALNDLLPEEKLQITLLNQASPLLAYEVIRDGVLLHAVNEETRIRFAVRAMKRYFDYQHWLEFQNQALLQRIQEVGLGRRRRRSPRTLEAAQRIHQRLKRTATD
jgi:hypothetical protein